MKLINCICGADSCIRHLWSKVVPRHIDHQMSEDDILFLQDIFLTNGVHAINVADVRVGRSIVHSMLQSLNFYQAVACMTCDQTTPLAESIIDVYSFLSNKNYDLSYEEVEHFFIEEFFSDFLWIELSEKLINTSLFAYSFQALNELDMPRRIPIVTLSYT